MVWRGHYPDLLKTLQDKLSLTGTYKAQLTNEREDSKLMHYTSLTQNQMRFLIILLLLPLAALADITGTVVGVADGDTISVLDSSKGLTKVRLHQIDGPEKKQDFGQRSKQSLSELVYGKQVRIELADTDKYGRTVGKVWVNGKDANLEQVGCGMAWVYTQYANDPEYFAAERLAKGSRTGLWSQPNATAPWVSDTQSLDGRRLRNPCVHEAMLSLVFGLG